MKLRDSTFDRLTGAVGGVFLFQALHQAFSLTNSLAMGFPLTLIGNGIQVVPGVLYLGLAVPYLRGRPPAWVHIVNLVITCLLVGGFMIALFNLTGPQTGPVRLGIIGALQEILLKLLTAAAAVVLFTAQPSQMEERRIKKRTRSS